MFDLSLDGFCNSNGYLIELSDNAGCECGSESRFVQPAVDGLFGSSPNDTIPICGLYFEMYPFEECDSFSGIYTDILGIEDIGSVGDYADFYESLALSSITDGAGNPLDPDEYISYADFSIYIEAFGDDYLYASYNLFGEFCLLYTSPSPRDATLSRMPSSA